MSGEARRESDRLVERFSTIDGVSIFHREGRLRAEGRPVVLLHGIGVSSRYMIPLAHELAPHHDVRVLDLPGFGRSHKPRRALDIGGMVAVLEGWIEACGLDRTVLFGNSFGCQLAVAYATEYPSRVDRLVLQGPTMDSQARSWHQLIGRWLRDMPREPPSLLPVLFRDFLDCGARRIIASLHYAFHDAIEEKVSGLSMPILVVRGKGDTLSPRRWVDELTTDAPQARLIEIEGAHALNFSHAPELAAIITAFSRD
jgi:2-hydroxy-6-oxonona-2,4-dienedioate hydrolase